jgi:hypothetical protein
MEEEPVLRHGNHAGVPIPRSEVNFSPEQRAGSPQPPEVPMAADGQCPPSAQVQRNTVESSPSSLDFSTLFMQNVTKPLSTPLLHLPETTQPEPSVQIVSKQSKEGKQRLATRCSPRFKNHGDKRKLSIKLAQEVLAKKWGILDVDKDLENLTLQQYVDIYRKPLSHSAMMAGQKLTEVAVMKKKKKMEQAERRRPRTPPRSTTRRSPPGRPRWSSLLFAQ